MRDDYGSLFVCVSVCVVTKLQQAFTCTQNYYDEQTRIKDYSECFYMIPIHKYVVRINTIIVQICHVCDN